MSDQRRQGFVLADKPIEWGSARLVGQLQRTLLEQSPEPPSGRRKRPTVGHTGTLDRFAGGLMLLLVGRCTALADFFLHADKTYLADFAFGQSTDTHDCTGAVDNAVPEHEARIFFESRLDDIQAEIRSFINWTQQQPPLF
ncbi:MAG: hypothetical protein KDK34_00200, partial [Leptospiraceae bacterium]|nr:hypothetical protein [Leptospiraceae bacterium]